MPPPSLSCSEHIPPQGSLQMLFPLPERCFPCLSMWLTHSLFFRFLLKFHTIQDTTPYSTTWQQPPPFLHHHPPYSALFSLIIFSSIQFSCSVMSDSLRPHELQHARPPCPSPSPRVHPNSYPSSQWCHPTISSSVVPFSSCPQSLPASESFPMSQLFAWGGQSIGVSASASVLPESIQDWSPLEWTDWISLQSKGLSRVFSNTTDQKHQFFGTQLSSQSNSHIHTWLLEKP